MTLNYTANFYRGGFDSAVLHMGKDLLSSPPVDTGHWQSLENVPHTATRELRNVLIEYPIPPDMGTLKSEILPNLEWAEDHFQERVSGVPLNPGEEYKNWPWYKGGVEDHKATGQFSHTYMERYWPKSAGDPWPVWGSGVDEPFPRHGIRFNYGDLNDVVSLLSKHPGTRQAYLPVWFPEDTGAVHGERVPCSIGYHFLLREGRLHCNYYIRSCDFLRYLRDDIYLTCRLTQWMCDQLDTAFEDIPRPDNVEDPATYFNYPIPGDLSMLIGSLHIFEGDLPKMRRLYG